MRILFVADVVGKDGRGAVSDRDYHAQTGLGANRFLVPQADVILAVGTRFAMMTSARFRAKIPETSIETAKTVTKDAGTGLIPAPSSRVSPPRYRKKKSNFICAFIPSQFESPRAIHSIHYSTH